MSRTIPTYQDFVTMYPHLNDPDYIRIIDIELVMAAAMLDSATWDDLYSNGVIPLTAHEVTLAVSAQMGGSIGGIQAAIGPLSSSSAAGVSVSFNTPADSGKGKTSDWYNKTVYGQKFLRLRRAVAPMAVLC